MNRGCDLFHAGLVATFIAAPALFAAPGDRVPDCASCHPKEAAAYRKSPMGNSIAPPTPLAGGRITRNSAGIEISIAEREGHMIHALSVSGLNSEFPVEYQVGAGKVGYTYLVRIRDYLFESPASWYRTHGWDVSPGYQQMSTVDFDRPIDSACLFCHADNARLEGSDGRRFTGGALQAVGCDRCHGLGDDHARQPSTKNIVNPAKLARRARNSICEQCHLEGETRLLNPGKSWQDFHAGDELERTAATYLLSRNGQEIRAVSQVEQLALSKCVRATGGKLWCATCHDPHGGPAYRATQIRDICLGCHSTLSKAAHPAITECVSCHMPRLTPDDIPHAASTDHRILRRPAPLPGPDNPSVELTAWQPPPAQFRDRDQALAALIVGGTHGLQSLHDKGAALLEALPQAAKDNDPAVLSGLVSIRLQRREPDQALTFAGRALEIQTDSGFAALSLSIALQNSGDDAGAEKMLLHTIDLDPSLQAAWINLAFLYERQGRQGDRIALLNRYLQWNPQSVWFRQLKNMLSQPH